MEALVMKRFLSVILACSLLLGLMPMTAPIAVMAVDTSDMPYLSIPMDFGDSDCIDYDSLAEDQSVMTFSNMRVCWEWNEFFEEYELFFSFQIVSPYPIYTAGYETRESDGLPKSGWGKHSSCTPFTPVEIKIPTSENLINHHTPGETYVWRAFVLHNKQRYDSQLVSFTFPLKPKDNPNDGNTVMPVVNGPYDASFKIGETATLSVSVNALMGTLSYQWYSTTNRTNTGGTLIDGAIDRNYSPPTNKEGIMYYYCVVTNTDSTAIGNETASKASSAARVTVNNVLVTEDKNSEVYYKNNKNNTVTAKFDHQLNWYLTNKSSTVYDPELAELAMAFSRAAYDSKLLEKSFDSHEFIDMQYLSPMYSLANNYKNPAFGVAEKKTEKGKIIAISIRGSETLAGDYLTDITVGFGFDDEHPGFKSALDNLIKELKDQNISLTDKNTTFFITGHSYGGALANMLAERLIWEYNISQSNVFSYTFATPNVARAWGGSIKKCDSIFNIVNTMDTVPKLPYALTAELFNDPWVKYGITYKFTTDYGSAFGNHAGLNYLEFLKQREAPNKEGYLDVKKSSDNVLNYILHGIFCPVDVDILDSNGKVIAKFVDNQPQYFYGSENELILYALGDEKYVVLPTGQIFDINLTGTDYGEMDYIVFDINMSDDIQREVVFEDIPLNKGKKYTGSTSGEVGATPESYNLIADDGTIISYSYVRDGGLPFTDVYQTDWFYNDVKIAYESNLINGTSATTFSPDNNLTYAEAIKLAACMHQKYTTGSVTLANGSPWYQNYVDYAKANRIIVQDYDWNSQATRSGYMEIFANALPISALSEINIVVDGAIPDIPSTNPSAVAIYKLYRAGIVQGVDAAHNCNPSSNMSRSEVAAILTRMMDSAARVSFQILPTEKFSSEPNEPEIEITNCYDKIRFFAMMISTTLFYYSDTGFYLSDTQAYPGDDVYVYGVTTQQYSDPWDDECWWVKIRYNDEIYWIRYDSLVNFGR